MEELYSTVVLIVGGLHAAFAKGLVPKCVSGDQLLKRVLFGKLFMMPAGIDEAIGAWAESTQLSGKGPV